MTATYWEIGRRIVEWEQAGKERATYGEALLNRLAADLTKRFGRGFSRQNLQQMRQFYRAYPPDKICQTLSGKLPSEIRQTTSGEFEEALRDIKDLITTKKSQTQSAEFNQILSSKLFPLPWSHYIRLLSLKNPEARTFYETEVLREGWSVRQLERQIATQFYERTALSKNKATMLKKGAKPLSADSVTPEEEIKDPFVLEFLGLKDEYSENDLEDALIHKLEAFLLELGGDFAFIGRQRRLRIGDEWYRVDLIFFHRRLRCLVVIDLKLGKFTHADAGQMHLYLNYAREHWTRPDENPPVGLILCAQKDNAVAHYALEGLPNKVLAAEYRTTLPDEKTLSTELERTRRMLEERSTIKLEKKPYN
ncbi:MAG: PDDEXK nuclease domain-containing protein [Candidatus Brocadia sp.]|nr:PDDEXK nuclease domain-containing protein [Candidatus Brocadia sp.]